MHYSTQLIRIYRMGYTVNVDRATLCTAQSVEASASAIDMDMPHVTYIPRVKVQRESPCTQGGALDKLVCKVVILQEQKAVSRLHEIFFLCGKAANVIEQFGTCIVAATCTAVLHTRSTRSTLSRADSHSRPELTFPSPPPSSLLLPFPVTSTLPPGEHRTVILVPVSTRHCKRMSRTAVL